MDSRKLGLTEGTIWKQLLLFFFPILIGTFFQQLYNTVDTIIVGQYVGTSALAAVGSTGNLTNLIINFFVGLSSGATVVIAQFYGANEKKRVSKAVHTSIAMSLVCGVFMTLFGLIFAYQCLQMIGTPLHPMQRRRVERQPYLGKLCKQFAHLFGRHSKRLLFFGKTNE